MNQFDNVQFLQHSGIRKMEDLLQEYLKLQQDIIKKHYLELIRTDNQWKQSLNETIFMPFKIKYLNCTQYNKYNDLILFACLDYDIDRLNIIISNNNSYYIKKTFISSKCLNINSFAFMYMFSNIMRTRNQKFSNCVIYNPNGPFAEYINIRVISSVYSVLIPFYITQYKNENLDKEERRFIINILKNYIENYKYYSSSFILTDINIEYLEKMKLFALLIQNFFIQNFINHPSEYSLHLLLHSSINKIDKSTSAIIINYIKQKVQCKLKTLTLIKQYCILTDEQQNIINSHIILANL